MNRSTSMMRQIALPACAAVLLALVGCAPDQHSMIPNDAMMENSGQKELHFHAQQPGTVYIYNQNTHKLLYSGDINRDQTLDVNTAEKRVSIDGRTVLEGDLNEGDTRAIYFKSGEVVQQKVIVEEHRTVTDHVN